MKIERMNKGSWGKVRAFFDLTTTEGFTMKGFKIIEGINGLFVSPPSQKGSDGEYYDTVFADKDLRDELQQVALRAYGQESVATTQAAPMMEESFNTSSDQSSKPEENSDASPPKSEEFSDDDIPF